MEQEEFGIGESLSGEEKTRKYGYKERKKT
jgi:hypothetical protein